MGDASKLFPDLDTAVQFASRIAAIQAPGKFLLRFMAPTSTDVVLRATYWLDNRDTDFAGKVRQCLQRHGNDLLYPFYAVNSFRTEDAKAENVAGCTFAHVDADRVQLPPRGPRPSFVVETSPGNHQLLYILNRAVEPAIAQKLSRALTRLTGGDPGGHSPAKLLRLPGTRNFKPDYGPDYPTVRVLEDSGEVHSVDELSNQLGPERESHRDRDWGRKVIDTDDVDVDATIERLKSRLSREARFRLREKVVWPGARVISEGKVTSIIPREDCSAACFRFGLDLRKAGATEPEVKALIPTTAVWKDRLRRGKNEDINLLVWKIFSDASFNASKLGHIDPADFEHLPIPVRQWLVEGLLPMRKVTALYGDGAVGKTLLSMQLAVAVALGLPFLGRPVRQGPVYAFLAEDEQEDTHLTFEAIRKALGISYDKMRGRIRILPRAGFENVLMTFIQQGRGATPLFQALLADIKEFRPVLVILDTAADLFDGNENDRSQVRRFINEICGRIAVDTGAAVLLCAHPSVAGMRDGHGYAGSTAWSNTVRSRLYLRRELDKNGTEPDPDVRILQLMKANLTKQGEEISLKWADGVLKLNESDLSADSGASSENENRTVQEVRRAFDERDPYSKHAQSRDRYIVHWMMRALKLSRKKAEALLKRLLGNGALKQTEYATRRSGLCTPEQAAQIHAKKRPS